MVRSASSRVSNRELLRSSFESLVPSVWIPGLRCKSAHPGMTERSAFAEHAPEDGIDMLEVIAEVELLGDLGV
jgi:hypothetical protein